MWGDRKCCLFPQGAWHLFGCWWHAHLRDTCGCTRAALSSKSQRDPTYGVPSSSIQPGSWMACKAAVQNPKYFRAELSRTKCLLRSKCTLLSVASQLICWKGLPLCSDRLEFDPGSKLLASGLQWATWTFSLSRPFHICTDSLPTPVSWGYSETQRRNTGRCHTLSNVEQVLIPAGSVLVRSELS